LKVSRPALINAIPDFLTAGAFLVTWIAPATFGLGTVKRLEQLMLVEFIVIHTAAFTGTVLLASAGKVWRVAAIIGVAAFYGVPSTMGLVIHETWPAVAFTGLSLNRLLGVLLGQVPDYQRTFFIQASWAASVVFFVGGAFLTIPMAIPALGITPAIIAAQHYPIGGLWMTHPERLLAWGLLYFALTGCWEILSHEWATNRRPARRTFRS
jgi:hypothetical protein